jgi:hypothetical protein
MLLLAIHIFYAPNECRATVQCTTKFSDVFRHKVFTSFMIFDPVYVLPKSHIVNLFALPYFPK